ncbi:hypothetical protein Hdeb2414_s0003g00115541 [Helianthus debilis subsp. tardiflorus]
MKGYESHQHGLKRGRLRVKKMQGNKHEYRRLRHRSCFRYHYRSDVDLVRVEIKDCTG